jgi:hypothetical protein
MLCLPSTIQEEDTMERHLIDTGRTRNDGIRLREYLRVARQGMRGKLSCVLHRQPHSAGSGASVRQYTRIERGRSA